MLHCIQRQVPKTHQSSGLTASGSGIFGLSSQSSGFRSSGSSISREGFTGGVMSFNRFPLFTTDWSTKISKLLSGFKTEKIKCNFKKLISHSFPSSLHHNTNNHISNRKQKHGVKTLGVRTWSWSLMQVSTLFPYL